MAVTKRKSCGGVNRADMGAAVLRPYRRKRPWQEALRVDPFAKGTQGKQVLRERRSGQAIFGDDLFGAFVDEGESGALRRKMELEFGAGQLVGDTEVLVLSGLRFEDV